jgi:hypothetical protein
MHKNKNKTKTIKKIIENLVKNNIAKKQKK